MGRCEAMGEQPLTKLKTDDILAGLNEALSAERQAVADYDAHAKGCERQGASPDIREALETLRDVEQEHARRLAHRIVALGGTTGGGEVEPQAAGETLAAWLTRDLQGEQWAIVEYARLVAGILDDDETAELMVELLMDEIRHAGWLKSTLRALGAGG
jgi:bacterioferritin (cytochrome b1)